MEQREQWELAQALSSRDRGRSLVKGLVRVDVSFRSFLCARENGQVSWFVLCARALGSAACYQRDARMNENNTLLFCKLICRIEKKYLSLHCKMEKLTTRKQYDEAKAHVEQLIAEATQKGMLEPDMDNDYTREISLLSQQMATYEDEYLNVLPLRQKSPFQTRHQCRPHP